METGLVEGIIIFTLLANVRFFTSGSARTLTSGCPPPEHISFCSCLYGSSGNILICNGLQSDSKLQEVVDGISGWNFRTLFICQSNLSHIPLGLFHDGGFKNLLLANCNLRTLFGTERHRENEENSIELLHINDVRIGDDLNWMSSVNLKKVAYLNLQHVEVQKVEQKLLEGFGDGLKRFLISNTKTQEIEDGAFAKMAGLFEIQIRSSNVTELRRSVFRVPSMLRTIDFTSNYIESLSEDLFTEMPELKSVYLDNNRIVTLSRHVFEPIIDQIDLLSLTGNPLNCSCEMEWLLGHHQSSVRGMCSSPPELKATPLSDLSPENFTHCHQNDLETIKTEQQK